VKRPADGSGQREVSGSMQEDELGEDGASLFEATKVGRRIDLKRDPHPDTTKYTVIEGPGILVLFPKDGSAMNETPTPPSAPSTRARSRGNPDRNAHFRNAFQILKSRVPPSSWTASSSPFTDMLAGLNELAQQPLVEADVAAYLDANPDVENAAEMLFTSVAMSARADWRSTPPEFRGIAARGWFLGRWVPTFLVLDGPILHFLTSAAFRRQNPVVPILRPVRKFFATNDFMSLRHAFAHWSFKWISSGNDSTIIGTERLRETVRATRAEADAFHIVTFGLIEAIDDVFLSKRRAGGASTARAQSGTDGEIE
jgi:hypothetical protein